MTEENTQNFAFTTEWLRISLGVINTLFAFFATLGNVLALLVVIRKKSMRTRSNILLSSLAVTDLLVGVVLDPITVVMLLSSAMREVMVLNTIRRFMAVVLIGASVGSIAVISYDRYIHLSKLLQYKKYMTRRKMILSLLAAWLLPILTPLFRLFTKNELAHSIIIVVYIAICLTIICVSYGVTLFTLKKKKKQSEHSVSRSTCYSIKAAKSTLIIIACFLITVTPVMLFSLVLAGHNMWRSGFQAFEGSIRDDFYLISMTAGQANSAINPLVYYFRIPGFRRHMDEMIVCFRSHRKDSSSSEKKFACATTRDAQICVVYAERTENRNKDQSNAVMEKYEF